MVLIYLLCTKSLLNILVLLTILIALNNYLTMCIIALSYLSFWHIFPITTFKFSFVFLKPYQSLQYNITASLFISHTFTSTKDYSPKTSKNLSSPTCCKTLKIFKMASLWSGWLMLAILDWMMIIWKKVDCGWSRWQDLCLPVTS